MGARDLLRGVGEGHDEVRYRQRGRRPRSPVRRQKWLGREICRDAARETPETLEARRDETV